MNALVKAFFALAALLAIASASHSQTVHIQGGGNVIVADPSPARPQSRWLPPFSGIRTQLACEVTYSVDGPPGVTVYAPANILPLVETRVENGVLVVSLGQSVALAEPIRLRIGGPSPNLLVASGAGHVRLAGVDGPRLTVNLSGAGNVWVDGRVGELTVSLSGAGNLHAAQLWASRLQVNLSGAGNVEAHAGAEAWVDVSGAGNVRVFGNPPRRQVHKSGAGNIDFL